MHWSSLVTLTAAAPASALIRFGCSQLILERLDPLVNPGMIPSTHAHQIIGGNSFNATMDPELDIGETSTCTTCQFSEDFSNYWTAILYFQARNGSYYRVPQIPNAGFEKAKAGMTVYYMQDALQTYQQTSKVTAFKKGFRMLTGDPTLTTAAEAKRFRQLTFTCLETLGTRFPETQDFPSTPCKAGIMANLRFPTCWDGRNLDSASHRSHVAYPEKGTFETQGPCPDSHPVRLPQLMYETIWDTTKFNDPNEWPEDRPHPFVWSFGDKTGYGTHGDYVFGWKGDSLQRAMDSPCFVNCPTLKTQGFDEMNSCSIERTFDEELTGWLDVLPGQENMNSVS